MPRISELPAATTPLAGDEEVAIVQSGVTKKVDADEFGGGGGGGVSVASKATDYTITGNLDDNVFLMTTGGVDRTIDLPDSATDPLNAGDEFEIHKVDAGIGKRRNGDQWFRLT